MVPLNMFKPSSIFFDHSDASFGDSFCYLCFTFCSPVGNVYNCRYLSDCRSRGCEFDPSLVPYFRRDWSWNNSTAILLPFADSRRVVFSYKLKYVHKVLVNRLVKPAQQKKVWLDELPSRHDQSCWLGHKTQNQTKHLSLLCCLVFSLQPCDNLMWSGWPLLAILRVMFSCFCHLPIWCLGLCVVLDCTDTWSLPSLLLIV